MRILVTGVTGFVGKHVVHSWRQRLPTAEIWGVVRTGEDPSLPLHGYMRGDVRDPVAVRRFPDLAGFDWIVHLEAQSFVPEALACPQDTWQVNLWGTFHLLEALRAANFTGRMLFVGSGGEYGKVDEAQLPVKEEHPLRPTDPYTASKAAAELLCYQYSQTYHLDVVLARPFNHIGPGQSPRFVVANFAQQIARIALGQQEPVLTVGNLNVSRDFLDVRDVVDAYRCLLESGRPGEVYNVCSGKEVRLTDVVATLVSFAPVPVEVRVDPARFRPTDAPRVLGNHEKLTAQTGWTPQRDLTTTLREVFLYWKEERQR